MSRKRDFPPDASVKEKVAIALFSKLANPRAQKIFSSVALWPDFERALSDSLGNFAQVVRWTAMRDGKRRQFTEARIHPAIDALLDIVVPALCRRDAEPFKEYAAAIEAMKSSRFPNLPVVWHTLNIACELTGHAPPFNAAGESLLEEHPELCEPGELKAVPDNAKGFKLPIIQAELHRRVEARSKQIIDRARFFDLCRRLKITCAKDPAKGGRKRKS